MKKLLIFALFLGSHTAVMAQESNGLKKNKSVCLEVLGPSDLAGISYDARLNDHAHFGWRAGSNFDYGYNSSIFREGPDVRGYAAPLEVNYLLGSQENSPEVGVDVNVDIYNIHGIFVEPVDSPKSSLSADQQKCAIGECSTPEGTKTWLACSESRNKFDYYFFGDIDYRHVSSKGSLFRVGFNPSFTIGRKSAAKKAFFYPYLGFDWAS